MKLFVVILFSITGLADTNRLEIRFVHAGSNYYSIVTAPDVLGKPGWQANNENPPLTSNKAIELARQELIRMGLTKVETAANAPSLQKISLQRFSNDHWLYVVFFEIGESKCIQIPVLMDGTIPKFQVVAEALEAGKVGLVIATDGKLPKIMELFENSPAAGNTAIKRGMFLLGVGETGRDGNVISTEGLSLPDITKLITGPVGSKVVLKISANAASADEKIVELVRVHQKDYEKDGVMRTVPYLSEIRSRSFTDSNQFFPFNQKRMDDWVRNITNLNEIKSPK